MSEMSEIRRLLITTTALVSLSTIAISILEPQQISTIFDGFYFSVITLTTVGFGDISPESPLGKAFTMLLSLLGLGLFQAVVDIVGQWRDRWLVPMTRSMEKPLIQVTLTLAALLTLGSFMFSTMEGWSMHDSAYFSIVTATTGELLFQHCCHRKIYTQLFNTYYSTHSIPTLLNIE